MNCDVGNATEGLENELWRRWSDGNVGEWVELIVIVIAELILQHFRHLTYVTTHSPTLPSLYLRHSSFYNPSVASPISQLILQPFFRFSYVTGSSLTSFGEPMLVTSLELFDVFSWYWKGSSCLFPTRRKTLFRCSKFIVTKWVFYSDAGFVFRWDDITTVHIYLIHDKGNLNYV